MRRLYRMIEEQVDEIFTDSVEHLLPCGSKEIDDQNHRHK